MNKTLTYGLGVIVAVILVWLAYSSISWRSTPPSSTGPDPMIIVSYGSEGVTVINDSDVDAWEACDVRIQGGYSSPGLFDLPPRGRETVYFSAFTTASGATLRASEGRSRAQMSLEVGCGRGPNGNGFVVRPRSQP